MVCGIEMNLSLFIGIAAEVVLPPALRADRDGGNVPCTVLRQTLPYYL